MMEEILRRILESAVTGFAGDQVMKRTGLGDRAEGILDKLIPPAAASDSSSIPPPPNYPAGVSNVPSLPENKLIPADQVMTPDQEQMVMNRIATEAPERPRVSGRTYLPDMMMQEPTDPAMVDVTNEARKNEVQDFVRMVGGRTQALMKEAPEGNPQEAAALATTEAMAAKGMSEEDDGGFFDNVGGFLTDLFGDEERMTRMALAFNSMRLQPDQGLAQVLGKRLELLGTRKKANATAAALRAKGTPAAIAAADYIEQTGDAKGGIKMAMEADQYFTGSGKEIEEKFGIKGLVANQPYRFNKLTKKVEGVGGGATNIYAVKPDKGYMLVPDTESGGVKQVPIPGGPAEEALKEREAGKETMTDIITDAANSIRSSMSGGLLPETGTIGSLLSYIGETDAAEVRRQVNVLKSQAQVETLNSMRRQSPTGGALGSVTERELSMLSAKAGALDPTADAKTFLAAVDDYQRTLYRIVHGREAGDKIFEAEMAKYGQSSQSQAATNGVTKAEDYFK
jgi:hypothetical protein